MRWYGFPIRAFTSLRQIFDLTTEMNVFADLIKNMLETMENFQLQTNQGPTIQVMPHVLSRIATLQGDLEQFKSHLNKILT